MNLDLMFAACLDSWDMMKVEHRVNETTCGEIGKTSMPAVLITTRVISHNRGKRREYRIQRTVVFFPQDRIPQAKMVREAKAQNAADLWAIALASK